MPAATQPAKVEPVPVPKAEADALPKEQPVFVPKRELDAAPARLHGAAEQPGPTAPQKLESDIVPAARPSGGAVAPAVSPSAAPTKREPAVKTEAAPAASSAAGSTAPSPAPVAAAVAQPPAQVAGDLPGDNDDFEDLVDVSDDDDSDLDAGDADYMPDTPAVVAPTPAPAPPLLSAEAIYPHLINYGLLIVRRDPVTRNPSYVACRFCAVHGISRKNTCRKPGFIFTHRVPLHEFLLQKHASRDHPDVWPSFSALDEGGKQKFFEGKSLPPDRVFHDSVRNLEEGMRKKAETMERKRLRMQTPEGQRMQQQRERRREARKEKRRRQYEEAVARKAARKSAWNAPRDPVNLNSDTANK